MAGKPLTFLSLGFVLIWMFGSSTADFSPIRWGCPLPRKPTPKDCGGKRGTKKCEALKDCLAISSDHVCCGTNCGGTACIEIIKRPGECPVKPLGVSRCPGINPVLKCGVDSQCKDKKQKCCFDGCKGTDCFDPKGQLAEKRKFGCPIPPRNPPKNCPQLDNECRSDGGCPGGQVCCQDPCGHNYCYKGKRQKRGECPKVDLQSSFCSDTDRLIKCGVDQDCPKNLKCCQKTNCGGTICRLPCIDSKTWRGTVKSENNICTKCTCKKLNQVGVLMARACTNGVAKVREGCCKSCQEYAPFIVQ